MNLYKNPKSYLNDVDDSGHQFIQIFSGNKTMGFVWNISIKMMK